jgi:hypothetical protein
VKISGKIRERNGDPIHGLTVELLDTKLEHADRLGKILTTEEGRFAFAFDPEEFADLFSARPHLILRVRDRWGNLIYTAKKTMPWKPGLKDLNLLLESGDLREHLRIPTTWQRVSGPLVPKERLGDIEAAINLLAPPGTPGNNRYRRAAFCPGPDIMRFDTLVEDAFEVLAGNTQAAGRFTKSLRLLERDRPNYISSSETLSHKGVSSHHGERTADSHPSKMANAADPEEIANLERWLKALGDTDQDIHSDKPAQLVPEERWVPVALAAAYSGISESGSPYRYLSILSDQICGFGMLGDVWDAARDALGGNPASLKYFRTLLDQMGLDCGPDDGPLPPWPEPKPRPNPCPGPWPPEPDGEIPLLDPNEIELIHCLIESRLVVVNELSPPYHIDSILPQPVCAGAVIEIRGFGFGHQPGLVYFATIGGNRVAVVPQTWSDTYIQLQVPVRATCGDLLIRPFPVRRVARTCGRHIDVYGAGTGDTYFWGTEADIHSFTVNGRSGSTRVDPGSTITLAWDVCPHINVVTDLEIREGNNVLASLPQVVPVGTHQFVLQNYTSTTLVECRLTAINPCSAQPVISVIRVRVTRLADLTVDGIEVTQGLQFYHADQHLTDPRDRDLDNNLRLVQDKLAWVRVYVRSGMDPQFDMGQVQGVTAELLVDRISGGVPTRVGTFYPINRDQMITAQANPNYADERGDLDSSLNFILPAAEMRGRLQITAVLDPNGAIDEVNKVNNRRSVIVPVNLQQTLRAAVILIGYSGPDAAGNPRVIPPPTEMDMQATLPYTFLTYPISQVAQTRVIGEFTQHEPLTDVCPEPPGACGCSPNWDQLLSDLLMFPMNDGNQAGWIYCGVLVPGIPIRPVRGCGGGGLAVFPVGEGQTAAHEMAHAIGLMHAPCGGPANVDPAYPAYEPYDPPNIPGGCIGEYGLDIIRGDVYPPNTHDFMSYCGDGWVSVHTFRQLIFNVTLNPLGGPLGASVIGGGGAMVESRPDGPVPLLDLIGTVDEAGTIELISVARVTARYRDHPGAPSGLQVQLVDRSGRVLAADRVYLPSVCCGADAPFAPPFHFLANLPDIKGAAAIVFKRGNEEVYRRSAPAREPVLRNFRARSNKSKRTTILSWNFEHATDTEPQFWLQASSDGGQTWRGVQVGLRGERAELDLNTLPGGKMILRLLGHDGFYTATATTTVNLPPAAPEAVILHPPDGAAIALGAPLRLWGAGVSAHDGTLSGKALTWSSDKQGELGAGNEVWTSALKPGRHRLRLRVNDSGDRTAQSEIKVTIRKSEGENFP